MSFRARWFLLLVVGAAAALLIVAGVILAPRIRRQWRRDDLVRELATARARQDESACRQAASALVGFEGAEALLALIDDFRAAPSSPGTEERMLDAVELFATRPEPRDPRPRAALEALAQDSNPTLRCWGLYLLEELANPTHAREPLGFLPPWVLVRCNTRDPLRSVRAVTTLPIEAGGLEERLEKTFNPHPRRETSPSLPEEPPGEDTPWRMLVRIAQRIDARVTFDGQKIQLVPRSHWDSSGWDGPTLAHPPTSPSYPPESAPVETTLKAVPPAVFLESFQPVNVDLSRLDPENLFRVLTSMSALRLVRKTPTTFEAHETLTSKERLRRIVAAMGNGHPELACFLLEYTEPGAFLAMFDEATRYPPADDRWSGDSFEELLVRACELVAMTRAPDARIAAALKKLETDPIPRRRFLARYLEDELAAPTFPAPPPAFAGKPAVLVPERASLDEALAVIAQTTGVPIAAEGRFENLESCVERAILDEPWRALVRLAQNVNAHIAVDSGSVRVVETKRVRLGLAEYQFHEIPDIYMSDCSRALRAFRFALEDDEPRARVARALSLIRGCDESELASEAARAMFFDFADADAPEGCCALAHLFTEWPLGSTPCGRALERAVRLHLADTPHPTVRERLTELTGLEPRVRFFGFYLLDLLDHPPSPAPPLALRGSERVVVDLEGRNRVPLVDAVAPIVSVVGPVVDISPSCANQTVPASSFTDRPWRALLRIALDANDALVGSGDRVSIEPGKRLWSGGPKLETLLSDIARPVTIVPPARLECPWSDGEDLRAIYGDLEAERALRALAKLNGCEVREKDDGTLEVRSADANGGR